MTLDYGNYGIFLIMGNAGIVSSNVVTCCLGNWSPRHPLAIAVSRHLAAFPVKSRFALHGPRRTAESRQIVKIYETVPVVLVRITILIVITTTVAIINILLLLLLLIIIILTIIITIKSTVPFHVSTP